MKLLLLLIIPITIAEVCDICDSSAVCHLGSDGAPYCSCDSLNPCVVLQQDDRSCAEIDPCTSVNRKRCANKQQLCVKDTKNVKQCAFECVEDFTVRATNAANVATAGFDACRSNTTHSNTTPFLTKESYMSIALGIIGGALNLFKGLEMGSSFQDAMVELNQRFMLLELDMNHQFSQLAAFVDRKQFESDITDPTSILWGQLRSFSEWPNDKTHDTMAAACTKQTAWQIAIKLENRLNGPDNTIMTQIKANQWSNSTFMATKDVIMSRMFQLMMVQAFCIGFEQGPNYNITSNWEMIRMQRMYDGIVNAVVQSRITQERDYFKEAIPSIVAANMDHGYLYNTLSNLYSWDRFIVDAVFMQGSSGSGEGYSPYAAFQFADGVWIARYWVDLKAGPNPLQENFKNCLDSNYDKKHHKFTSMCGTTTMSFPQVFTTYPRSYSLPEAHYIAVSVGTHDNRVTGLFGGSDNRPTTIHYDLGFWERPIPIQLLPYNS